MSKRKRTKLVAVRSEFLLVLGMVIFIFALVVLRVSQNALGDEPKHSNNGSKGYGQGGDQPSITATIAPTVQPTVAPTVAITTAPTIQPTVVVTIAPIVQPTVAPETQQIIYQSSQISTPIIVQPEIKSIPISGMSIISAPSQPAGTSAGTGGSILDTIKRGIDSIGKAGKTTIPGTTPTPIPTRAPAIGTKEPEKLPEKMKLKYQIKGDLLVLTAEDNKENTVVVDEIRLREIEAGALNRLEKRGIVLNLTTANKFAIGSGGVTAITDLPIMVDVETRSLLVLTEDGPRAVTFLPDIALKNIVDLGVIANVNTKEIPVLEYSGGEVVYKFGGLKIYKMLGRFDVTMPMTIFVSAKTGDVISRDQPLMTQMVRLISI